MEDLRKKLLSLKTADEQAITLLENLFKPVEFNRNGFLYAPDFPSATLYYITRGLVRGVVSEQQKEYCLWVIDKGFIVPGNGFITGAKTHENIEVLAKTKGYSLNLLRTDAIARNNVNMYRMLFEIYEEALLDGRRRELMLRIQKASDRYNFFRENFPSLNQRLTVQQQAEYLHIGRKYFYDIKK